MTLITYPSVSADNNPKIARHRVLELSQLGQSLKKKKNNVTRYCCIERAPHFGDFDLSVNLSAFVAVAVFGTRFRPANQLAIDSIAIQISADTTNRFVI